MPSNGTAPVTAEHPDGGELLGPVDDKFLADAAAAGQPARARKTGPADAAPVHCRVYFKQDLKAARLGVIEITMQVPWEYRDSAYRLLDLAGHPMDLYCRPSGPRGGG